MQPPLRQYVAGAPLRISCLCSVDGIHRQSGQKRRLASELVPRIANNCFKANRLRRIVQSLIKRWGLTGSLLIGRKVTQLGLKRIASDP